MDNSQGLLTQAPLLPQANFGPRFGKTRIISQLSYICMILNIFCYIIQEDA